MINSLKGMLYSNKPKVIDSTISFVDLPDHSQLKAIGLKPESDAVLFIETEEIYRLEDTQLDVVIEFSDYILKQATFLISGKSVNANSLMDGNIITNKQLLAKGVAVIKCDKEK